VGHPAEKPDLLILDPDMPGMSGHDVMRAMREDPELQSVRVYLTDSKPFDPRKLLK
jgi:CheY-like chemotaxis protein